MELLPEIFFQILSEHLLADEILDLRLVCKNIPVNNCYLNLKITEPHLTHPDINHTRIDLNHRIITLNGINKINIGIIFLIKKHSFSNILHQSIILRCFSSIPTILKLGVDVNKLEEFNGNNPLTLAIKVKSLSTIKLLVGAKANIHYINRYRDSLMTEAIISKDEEIINYLLNEKVNVNYSGWCGNNSLLTAIEYLKNKRLILKILERTTNINHCNEDGCNALIMAIRYGMSNSVINEIINRGINLEHQYANGNTALLYAVKCDLYEKVKLLLENGANIFHLNQSGESAFIIAKKKKYGRISKLLNYRYKQLLKMGVDIPDVDFY